MKDHICTICMREGHRAHACPDQLWKLSPGREPEKDASMSIPANLLRLPLIRPVAAVIGVALLLALELAAPYLPDPKR